MAEYIEREALIAEYDRVHIGEAGGARKLMVEAPACDVVGVVRCKDCKYALPYRDYYYCENEDSPFTNSDWAVCPNGDDFCSYGERK